MKVHEKCTVQSLINPLPFLMLFCASCCFLMSLDAESQSWSESFRARQAQQGMAACTSSSYKLIAFLEAWTEPKHHPGRDAMEAL